MDLKELPLHKKKEIPWRTAKILVDNVNAQRRAERQVGGKSNSTLEMETGNVRGT
jgi:hypothetical protein